MIRTDVWVVKWLDGTLMGEFHSHPTLSLREEGFLGWRLVCFAWARSGEAGLIGLAAAAGRALEGGGGGVAGVLGLGTG